MEGYTTGPDLEARLERLAALGGEREVIGRSREGRPIQAWRWDGAPGDPSRGILLLSLLHPLEWIGLEANLALLEGWLRDDPFDPRSSNRGPRIGPLYSIPIANPDGAARVEESLRRGRVNWVRGNAAGVDLNRNFPVGFRRRLRWLDFWPLYRPGPEALSEPETAAIARWVRGLDLRLSLSLHSYGRWIFHPPSHERRLTRISRTHAEAIRRACASPVRSSGDHNSGDAAGSARYRTGQLGRWSVFFRAHGTEIDFLADTTGGLAYLVEISGGGLLRWGARRMLQPFFAFNPPKPALELSRVLPILRRLAEDPGGAQAEGQK